MESILRAVNGDVAIYRFGTFCLITSLATTSQYFVLRPALETSTLPTWLTHIGFFNTGILYIYWTFYLSTKDPGQVSPKYLPPDASSARYCKKCQEFKPPRTRHCRQCNRCILKMDHHCPWLSGCVGFKNQAVFVEFLGWVVPTTGYLGIMMIRALLDIYRTTGLRTDPTFLFVVVYNMIAACLSCVFCFCLFVWQLWCISENITTVETLIKKRTDVLTRKHGLPKVDFPYDLYSVRANLREVFGPFYYYPWRYLWPVGLIAPSDGHSFPVNEDANGNDRWPPVLPETTVNSSNLDTTSKGQQNPDVPLRRREQKRREASGDSEDSEQDESTYEEYSRMGLLADSDGSDSDDYPDGDDESFGADDSEEAAHMDDLIGQDNVTLAQLIESRRQKLHDAKESYEKNCLD